MEIKLEELEYQQTAIKSIVNIFDGNDKNTFDNACTEGIRSNICTLSAEQLNENIKTVLLENGIDIHYVQKLLGHKKIRTTQIYIKITNPNIKNIKSPFV